MNETISRYTQGIPISLNLACKILHRGKAKVRSLIGVRIRQVADEGNSYGLNLADVLDLIGKQI